MGRMAAHFQSSEGEQTGLCRDHGETLLDHVRSCIHCHGSAKATVSGRVLRWNRAFRPARRDSFGLQANSNDPGCAVVMSSEYRFRSFCEPKSIPDFKCNTARMSMGDGGSPTPFSTSDTVPTTHAQSHSSNHASEQVPRGVTGATTNEHADDGSNADTNPNHIPPVVAALGATGIRPVGGPVPVAWREGTLTRAYELETLCNWVRLKHPRDSDSALVTAIGCHLDAARQAARAQPLDPRKRFRIFRNGPLIERATSNLDAAEAQLLNLAPPDYVLGQMPSLLRHVQRHLRPTDPGRQEFERIARSLHMNDPDHPSSQNRTDEDFIKNKATIDKERGTIVATVRAASSECLREQLRLRSFRNVVVITAVLMALLAVGIALTGVFNKTLVPLCFAPKESGDEVIVVCPTAQSGPFIPLQAGRAGQAGGTGRAGARAHQSSTSTMLSQRRPNHGTSSSSNSSDLPPLPYQLRPPSATSEAHPSGTACPLLLPRSNSRPEQLPRSLVCCSCAVNSSPASVRLTAPRKSLPGRWSSATPNSYSPASSISRARPFSIVCGPQTRLSPVAVRRRTFRPVPFISEVNERSAGLT